MSVSRGWLAGEYIASGLDQAAAGIRANAEASASLDSTKKLIAAKEQIEQYNAANLAEKHALRAALRKLDPQHPLLINASLQERIKSAGVRAMAIADSWDAAREAGDSFKY